MSVNLTQIASQIVATLRATDPDLDTSVGTTTRKIIDAVSESIAEAYIDQQLINYQYDIDSKVDADLDDFVQLFGMARLPPKRAAGVVTFYRTAHLTTVVVIPSGTVITSNTNPEVSVQTVATAFLELGATNVSVPVQAVDPGVAGNLQSNTLVKTGLGGVASVSNMNPLSGGTAQESDPQLRARWKATVFRSLAGTEQMYMGVALDDQDCYIANVLGGSKTRREQIQVVSGEAATTVDDASFVFNTPVFVGANIDAGDILVKDVDYTWDIGVNPPKVVVIDAAKMPEGGVFEIEFEYEPDSSRNDVANGITNRVDVWCGGQRARGATQVVIFRTGAVFNNTGGSRLYRQDFRRLDDTAPTNAHIFVPLAYGPILTVPSTLTIGGVIYGLVDADHPMDTTATVGSNTIKYAYRIVHRDFPFGYTPTADFGLEWSATSGYHPANDSVFTIGEGSGADSDYTFNAMITDIQANTDRWRLLGVDAKVHQAKQVDLRMSVAIVYLRSTNISLTNTQIDQAVSSVLTGVGFQGKVQVSDILQAIHNVPGVDNVRFLHGDDAISYNPVTPNAFDVGIQRVADRTVIESFVDAGGRPLDIALGDAELPVLESIIKVTKADNSFGVA